MASAAPPAPAAAAAAAAPAAASKSTITAGQHGFNEHPQPRTFAPSKEDVLQNLQYFFGAPVSPEKLKDYSEHHAMTYRTTTQLKPSFRARTPAPLRRSRAFPCVHRFPRRVCRTEHVSSSRPNLNRTP
jgi:hypothetical protein